MKIAGQLRGAVVALAVAGTLTGVSACGSSSSKTTSSAGSSASSGSSSTSSAGAASSGKKTPPKLTIGYVDQAATVGIQPQVFNVFKQGAAALGWKVILENANNTPATALQDTQLLIAQHVNAIVFSSIPSAYVHSALLKAKAAKIPTIDIENPTAPNTYSAQYSFKFTPAGQQLLVNELKRSVAPGAQVAVLSNPIIFQYSTINSALLTALKSSGFKVIQYPVGVSANIDQLYQKASAAVLQAHPGVKAMFEEIGFVKDDVIGIKNSGAKNVKLYSYQVASTSVPTLVQANSPLKALMWSDYDGTAALALDQLLDHFGSGAALAPALTTTKTKVYTASNLPAAVKASPSANLDVTPASTTLAPYLAKWGKTYALKTTS